MGASPSREAQERHLDELVGNRPRPWRVDRRRKGVTLLPLTKTFMHYVNPTSASPADPCGVSQQTSGSSHSDSGGSRTSGSARRTRGLAQPALDAAPASLPFVQQLYDAYREPSTQFYCRKEAWGHMSALPPELFYSSVEAFYDATVGCYEEYLFMTNDDMQHAFDQQQLARRLRLYSLKQKGAEPARRPKKLPATAGPQLRPIPCAICFEYPTSTVSHTPSNGAGRGYGGASAARGSGAPFGSVVLTPNSSFMVIGFVGLVPVRRQKRAASAETFLRPPADSAGDEGEVAAGGSDGLGGAGEPAEYELVAFISKSAGEQHLARALFQAAFLYLDQCRRAGLPGNPPLPAVRFSCFFTDVPSLCFLREVRLRCAEFGWRRRLARALRRLRLAAQHLAIEIEDSVAADLCAFLGEHFVQLECHPAPPAAPYCFYGFVGDRKSAAAGAGEAGATSALQPAPLPKASSEEVMAALQTRADIEGAAAHGTSSASGARGGKRDDAPESSNEPIRLICVVGTTRLTVGSVVYPHGTALARYVETKTGAFIGLHWSVAKDLMRHERLPTDFYAIDPEDAHDFSVCVPGADDAAVEPTLAVSDVILSWSKDLYLQARVAKRTDRRWGHAYPLDYYTTPKSEHAVAGDKSAAASSPSATAAQERKTRSSPLTAANVKALTQATNGDSSDAAADGDAAAASAAFHLWTFEHQGRRYTLGLVPNFVRAQQQQKQLPRRGANAAPRRTIAASPLHKPEPNTELTARAETVYNVVECALELASTADGGSSGTSQQLDASHSGGSGRSVHSGETYRTAASSHSTLSQLMGFRRSRKQRRVFLSLGTGQAYENGVPVPNSIGPAGSSRHSRCTSDGDSSAPSSGFHADPESGAATRNGAGAGSGGAPVAATPSRTAANTFGNRDVDVGARASAPAEGRVGPAGATTAAAPPLSSQALQQQPPKRYVNRPYDMGDQQLQPSAPALQRRLSGGVSRGLAGNTAEARSPKYDSTYSSQGGTVNGLSGGADGRDSALAGCASLHGFGPGGYMDGLMDYSDLDTEGRGEPSYITAPTTDRACAPAAGRVLEQRHSQQRQQPPAELRPQPRSGGESNVASSRGPPVRRVGREFPTQPLPFPTGLAPSTQAQQAQPVLRSAEHVQQVKTEPGQTRLRWDWREAGKR